MLRSISKTFSKEKEHISNLPKTNNDITVEGPAANNIINEVHYMLRKEGGEMELEQQT